MTARVAVLAGSLRDGSYNRMLAALAADALRAAGAEVTDIDLADYDLPIYRHEIEAAGVPEAAKTLKALFERQDALMIATPEYNGSISPLLKNALDWASRPGPGEGMTALTAYRGKAAGILSASISPFGGIRALAHLRQILGTMQMLVIPEQVMIPAAHGAFEDGRLKEALPAQLLDAMAARLVAVAGALSAG